MEEEVEEEGGGGLSPLMGGGHITETGQGAEMSVDGVLEAWMSPD